MHFIYHGRVTYTVGVSLLLSPIVFQTKFLKDVSGTVLLPHCFDGFGAKKIAVFCKVGDLRPF